MDSESKSEILQCYELLSMQYLEQSQDEQMWQTLHRWSQDQVKTAQVIVTLSQELWYIAVLLRENPQRLKDFLAKFKRQSLRSVEDDLLANYLQSFLLTEMYLDTTFRKSNYESASETNSLQNSAVQSTQITQNIIFRPPLAIFRCCPNVKILSLKNNNLDHLPPDIGRLRKLERLHLTNNLLQNGSIPYTLAFCRRLKELYLDDNLLDALPSVLLRIPSLTTVHRHGNHNYFKSTFMWYHTDVTGRILPTNPAIEEAAGNNGNGNNGFQTEYEQVNLQNIAARAIIASRINFYAAEIPFRLKNYISDMINTINPCENCSTVKDMNEPGFKVFTFRNPYLGNTCVPFLHWACDYNCARDIEIPARKEQIESAIEQDKLYEDHVRQAVDLMPNTSRSLSNISIQASPVVVSASTNCCISPSPQSDELIQYYQRSNNQAYCLIL